MTDRRNKEDAEISGALTSGLANALEAIPVFPLPQVVLFPEAVLPLHVF